MNSENRSVESHYRFNKKFASLGSSNVWTELTALTAEFDAVNLGQGMPNYQSYTEIKKIIEDSLIESNNSMYQYTRSAGHLRLVEAIGKTYSRFMNRNIDPINEILITIGADGSIFNAFSSFLEENDEAIIIEPFFDCYEPLTKINGGKCIFVPLRPTKKKKEGLMSSSDWSLDDVELEKAFSSKTKLIIINTPNNPLGKVYTRKELEKIAELCIRHNVLCLSDEVYEHLAFDREHIRIATLPGMWERTVTFGSSGKTFSTTGAKIGWTIGPKELIKLCISQHNNSIYVCPTFIQEVIGRCFELELTRFDSPECYYNSIKKELKPKRDRLAEILKNAGLEPIIPEGGYFMMADISKIANEFFSDEKQMKDTKFVKYLIKEKGLATIPSSAFYSKDHKKEFGENYIRFCFFKDESTLEKCATVLSNFKID